MKLKIDYQKKRITKIEYERRRSKLEKRLDDICKNPKGKSNKNVKRLRRRLRKHRDEIFTFLYYDGVDATNNIAERRIRPLALMRKVSFGSFSKKGVKTRYILMSLIQTCKIMEVDFIEYVRFCLNEHSAGRDVLGVHEYAQMQKSEKIAA